MINSGTENDKQTEITMVASSITGLGELRWFRKDHKIIAPMAKGNSETIISRDRLDHALARPSMKSRGGTSISVDKFRKTFKHVGHPLIDFSEV